MRGKSNKFKLKEGSFLEVEFKIISFDEPGVGNALLVTVITFFPGLGQ